MKKKPRPRPASASKPDLEEMRGRIDAVDVEIQRLISERAKLAQLVGISKSGATGRTVDFYRPER
jgi:chorismate mutase / prephenate dehydratase